jgi:uncharacterized protein YdcH (DUF465 family)
MGAVDTGDRAGQLAGEEAYRQLAEEHQLLDSRLHELTERPYLSTTEQFEEIKLKKRKLALKDQMARLAGLRRH